MVWYLIPHMAFFKLLFFFFELMFFFIKKTYIYLFDHPLPVPKYAL